MNFRSTDTLAARLEIVDLFSRYAYALDAKRWHELEPLFTEDVSARWLQGKWVQDTSARIIRVSARARTCIRRPWESIPARNGTPESGGFRALRKTA